MQNVVLIDVLTAMVICVVTDVLNDGEVIDVVTGMVNYALNVLNVLIVLIVLNGLIDVVVIYVMNDLAIDTGICV